jgi:hypothetical protein
MSYEDICTIIFVAVQVVKKEVIVHRAKTPPKQSLDGGTLDVDRAGVGPPPGEFQFVALSSLRSRHYVFGWRSGSPLR